MTSERPTTMGLQDPKFAPDQLDTCGQYPVKQN